MLLILAIIVSIYSVGVYGQIKGVAYFLNNGVIDAPTVIFNIIWCIAVLAIGFNKNGRSVSVEYTGVGAVFVAANILFNLICVVAI